MRCQCCDKGCAHCVGLCVEEGTELLTRIDMEDTTVLMCEGCATDALESGVFAGESPVDKPRHDVLCGCCWGQLNMLESLIPSNCPQCNNTIGEVDNGN